MVAGRATKRIFVALLLCLAISASCGGDSKQGTPTPAPSSPSQPASPLPSPTEVSPTGIPDRDLLDLAKRFRGLPADAERVARPSPYSYVEGDREKFYLADLSGPRLLTIDATVRKVTEHAYFFVQDGVGYPDSNLSRIGADFESIVYPTVTSEFGSEWSPGVDSDPRITILHAKLSAAAGFFSGSDEYPLAVVPKSNQREMVYLDVGALESPGVGYNALIGHEFQHLVHFNADPTEDSWVNEGMSEVAAEEVSGGGASGGIEFFLLKPDTQLTFWPEIQDSTVNYAASELFISYLLDHYGGRNRAKELSAQKADGIEGVNAYLADFGKTFEEVFADWVVANYADAREGPYSHAKINARVKNISTVDGPQSADDDVGQFAADYIDLPNAAAGSTFVFDGADQVGNGVPERSGAYWWSNRGDGIDTRLTREFDLTSVAGATLRFQTWYEIEKGWDYGYVAVSSDGGGRWETLSGQHTSDYNPVEAAYGPGYTGKSGGWVGETVDLSAYAGKKVLVRFEHISDDSTSFAGMAIDDIEVPELGFRDDVTTGGDWQAEGFTRVTAPAAQQFIVQKVEGPRDSPVVTRVALDAQNRAEMPLTSPALIVISGATENTAERAAYHWELRGS